MTIRIPADEFQDRNMLRYAREVFAEARDLAAEEIEGTQRLEF